MTEQISTPKHEEPDPMVITFLELRQAVGWLGILLPEVLVISLFALNRCSIQDSISQYYYTRVGTYFTGTLCAVGLFLFAYKGYPGEDDGIVCNFAAICAFGVAFIPMKLLEGEVPAGICIRFFSNDSCYHILHFVSAALLFAAMAYLSVFKFTKTRAGATVKKGEKKFTRNLVYKTCGVVIIICLTVLLVYNLGIHFKFFRNINTLTFFMETVMLWAFGFAWLVKGEGVGPLNDNKTDLPQEINLRLEN